VSSKKHPNEALLRSLLGALVDEWGYDHIVETLVAIRNPSEDQPLGRGLGRRLGKKSRSGITSDETPLRVKMSAMDRVKKTGVSGNRGTTLNSLAMLFDNREFLPALADIRYFLEMRGATLGRIDQRTDAFRVVLPALLEMSDDDLQKLVDGQLHRGPNRLAPLSDAIKASGATSRAHDLDTRTESRPRTEESLTKKTEDNPVDANVKSHPD
jgi:hypothetical protein